MRLYTESGRLVYETVNPNVPSIETTLLASEELADKIARELAKCELFDLAKRITSAEMGEPNV